MTGRGCWGWKVHQVTPGALRARSLGHGRPGGATLMRSRGRPVRLMPGQCHLEDAGEGNRGSAAATLGRAGL